MGEKRQDPPGPDRNRGQDRRPAAGRRGDDDRHLDQIARELRSDQRRAGRRSDCADHGQAGGAAGAGPVARRAEEGRIIDGREHSRQAETRRAYQQERAAAGARGAGGDPQTMIDWRPDASNESSEDAIDRTFEPADAPGPDLEEDRLHEECGVFGIFGHPDAAAIVALGLHALQHRGQEAAGIVAFDGMRFHSERRQGLVGDHFSSAATIDRLPGRSAIGHVRYSTTGETALRNVQPLFAELEAGGLAVAHNGNLTNGLTLRRALIRGGAICQSTTDTEVVLMLAARSRRRRIVDRFVEALVEIEGAYALVALTNRKLIGARDPLGIRPLVLGELDGSPILCSETCALDIIGAKFVRDVENGEVVVVDSDGVKSFFPLPRLPARPCIFEYVYFARPDSIVGGRSVYDARKAMGAELAREAPAEADVIVPVPDSGVPAAIGYARACGLPFELGIIRNHYVGRTFIQPTQSIRELGVRMKHNANSAVVAGKRVVLIDDSIVRGTTSVKIVRMMREAGAREVHFRISSPPIAYPDFYGIDTPERDKLLAARMDLETMRRFMAADSLAFLSIEGIYHAMGYPARNPKQPQFTDHCFTGDYPTRLIDKDGEPWRQHLPLLAEAS